MSKAFKLFLKKNFPSLAYKLLSIQKKDSRLRNIFLKYHNINLVLDVGADIGLYGHAVRHNGFSGRIVSFEPRKRGFEHLKKWSSKDPLWDAENYALGDFDGESEINVSENQVSSSLLDLSKKSVEIVPETQYIEKETIKVHKLDTVINNFYKNGDKVYLKVDTQGFEKKIMNGSLNSLNKLEAIQLELSIDPLYKEVDSLRDMLNFMDGLGFKLASFEYGWHDISSGHMMEVDGIFIRK